MLKKIEELNKTIEKLMVEKTKADAQKEVWEGKLKESIKDYKEKYGVDLSGKSFSDMKANLIKELKEVEGQTQKEYEQAQQVVSLIQSGDIKGAWKLLGVDLDEQEKQDEQEEEVKVDQQEELQGVSSVVSELDGLDDDDFLGDGSEEEDGDFFVEEDDEGESEDETSVEDTSFDDDDDDFIEAETEEVDEEEDEQEEEEVKDSFNFGGISFDDDDDDDDFISSGAGSSNSSSTSIEVEDDDDDDFGGFGNILKGSKFEV